jgi:hypothetical protein
MSRAHYCSLTLLFKSDYETIYGFVNSDVRRDCRLGEAVSKNCIAPPGGGQPVSARPFEPVWPQNAHRDVKTVGFDREMP